MDQLFFTVVDASWLRLTGKEVVFGITDESDVPLLSSLFSLSDIWIWQSLVEKNLFNLSNPSLSPPVCTDNKDNLLGEGTLTLALNSSELHLNCFKEKPLLLHFLAGFWTHSCFFCFFILVCYFINAAPLSTSISSLRSLATAFLT